MQLERKALYNLLRMNYENDPNLDVEPWQVEDYREIEGDELFDRLLDLGVALDEESFHAYAEQYDTPEDLAETLTDPDWEVEVQDQVFLILFELWRRLVPECLCLSIFCDELDYQIHQYDCGVSDEPDDIQDAIENLRLLLEQNIDEGADAKEAFSELSQACANDLESFLYDFISEQIDDGNESYASELLEGFGDFVSDESWFTYLKARVLSESDPEACHQLIETLVSEASQAPNLELSLEVLAFLIQSGELKLFVALALQTVGVLASEEDFQDLLQTCIDFFACLDLDEEEQAFQAVLKQRIAKQAQGDLDPSDPAIDEFRRILKEAVRAQI